MNESLARIRAWVFSGNLLEQASEAYGDFWQATQVDGAEITSLVGWLGEQQGMDQRTAARVSRLLRASGLIPRPTFPSGETTLSVTDATQTSVTPEELYDLLGLEVSETVAPPIEASVS